MAQLERRARDLNIPPRSFPIKGIIVRVPLEDKKKRWNEFGIIKWGEFFIFVRGSMLKKWRNKFNLDARVNCSIEWSDEHNKYQAICIHSIA